MNTKIVLLIFVSALVFFSMLDIVNSTTSENVLLQKEVAWWKADWMYRRPIKIANLLNRTLEGYEVLVSVNTRRLIAEGKMLPDCGDIRFITLTQHEIPFWLESGCNTDNTRIWVRVPTIPSASNTTIYMYYGNPNASSKSNGDTTFDFFDDFRSYNTSKWSEASFLPNYQGTPQILYPAIVDERSTLYIETAEQPEERLRGISSIASLYQNNDVITELIFQPLGDLDGVTEIWMFDMVTSEYIRLGVYAGNYGKNRVVRASLSGNMVQSSTVWSWGEWLKLRIEASDNTINTALLDVNENVRWRYTFSANLSTLLNAYKIALSQHLGRPYSGTWYMKSYLDRVIVRKYVSREPTYVIDDEEHLVNFPHVEINLAYVSDDRADVGSLQSVGFHAKWGHNGSDVVRGGIYVNGTEYITNGTGWIVFNANSSIVRRKTWTVTGVNANGIMLFRQTVENPNIIWVDRIKVEYNIESFNLGRVEVRVNTYFEYDGSPVKDATVRVNDVVAENIGNGRYKVILSTWLPYLPIHIKVEGTYFITFEADITTYLFGNIALETALSFAIVFTVAISRLKWVHTRKLRHLRDLIENKKKMGIEELAKVMNMKTADAEKLLHELTKRRMVEGFFTSDGKAFITEEKLKEEILRSYNEKG